MRNIEELQNAWSCWKPKAYSPIAVTVEKEVDNSGVRAERKGVFAYSGGVDGSFALLRHTCGEAGRRTVRPVTAVMTGRNCGRCEKCIRTKLNFMAAGKPPACFDRPPTLSEIVGLRVRNPIQLSYLTDILQTAINNGISDSWTKALQICVWKGKAELAARYFKQRMIGLAGFIGGKPRNPLN